MYRVCNTLHVHTESDLTTEWGITKSKHGNTLPEGDTLRIQLATTFPARGCRERQLRYYNMQIASMQEKK